MRFRVAVCFAIAVTGCGKGPGQPDTAQLPLQNGAPEGIAYIDNDDPKKLLKAMHEDPDVPDPALHADDPVSCRKAHGTWGAYYVLGVISLREPRDGAHLGGKMCWSNRLPRSPKILADAGKPCSGQADCIGNCVVERQENGALAPRCQAYEVTLTCGQIYDHGRIHDLNCPVP